MMIFIYLCRGRNENQKKASVKFLFIREFLFGESISIRFLVEVSKARDGKMLLKQYSTLKRAENIFEKSFKQWIEFKKSLNKRFENKDENLFVDPFALLFCAVLIFQLIFAISLEGIHWSQRPWTGKQRNFSKEIGLSFTRNEFHSSAVARIHQKVDEEFSGNSVTAALEAFVMNFVYLWRANLRAARKFVDSRRFQIATETSKELMQLSDDCKRTFALRQRYLCIYKRAFHSLISRALAKF